MNGVLALVRFIHTGGPVNWLIASLYVVVLALFSERLIYFFRTRYTRARLFTTLETATNPVFLPHSAPERMAVLFFTYRDEPAPVLGEILDREGAIIRGEMERGLGLLSFIGMISPLLGLLGTITGLMNAFSQIAAQGAAVDMAMLSGGIWEAMITTATGLVTAICALSCGKGFEHLTASRLQDMSFAVSILSQRFRRDMVPGYEENPENAAPPAQDRYKERVVG
ncbi:MAG: MotA/TolQ/ExbB proton channel family protein [Spirochaetaceae bacterium]|jgi:biopolymer transport protein ExbB|nr:MotA/TolQ/ExbB proton channel family protein [Spirochaetaceae bacterium]